ncbi:hypothetical protein ACQR1Q_34935 [Bradyrhizobium oligotrophicum]|uniref:hypothetical protein n=1 Tax=Bradyrhizobium oligotrophicum TaxID=44255 RepID=UPI003EBBFEDB
MRILLLFFCILLSPTASAELKIENPCMQPGVKDIMACFQRQEEAMLGKYLCTYTNIVGIQRDVSGAVSAGRVRSPLDKFFIEIARDNTLPCVAMGNSIPSDLECKTKYKLTANPDTQVFDSRQYSANSSGVFLSGSGKVMIGSAGRLWGYHMSSDSSYAFEGQCEKIN